MSRFHSFRLVFLVDKNQMLSKEERQSGGEADDDENCNFGRDFWTLD